MLLHGAFSKSLVAAADGGAGVSDVEAPRAGHVLVRATDLLLGEARAVERDRQGSHGQPVCSPLWESNLVCAPARCALHKGHTKRQSKSLLTEPARFQTFVGKTRARSDKIRPNLGCWRLSALLCRAPVHGHAALAQPARSPGAVALPYPSASSAKLQAHPRPWRAACRPARPNLMAERSQEESSRSRRPRDMLARWGRVRTVVPIAMTRG